MNLKEASNEALAAQIVVYRALGFNAELAIQCMQELANRRFQGNIFDYESFIDQELNKLPKSTLTVEQSQVLLQQSLNILKTLLPK